MIINIEWGNFAAPSLPMLEADGVIDHASVNPGAPRQHAALCLPRAARPAPLTLPHAPRAPHPDRAADVREDAVGDVSRPDRKGGAPPRASPPRLDKPHLPECFCRCL